MDWCIGSFAVKAIIMEQNLGYSQGAKQWAVWSPQVQGGSTRFFVFRKDSRLSWDDARSVYTENSMDLV